MPQISGLVAQIIIIKLIAIPEVAFRLPAYNFAISATSIVFLGLAYRQTRFVPALKHILGLQGAVLAYSLFFYITEGGRGYLIAGLCVSVLASVSIILLQMISRFTRSRYLIGATILSATAPNILWLDLPQVLAITCALLCVTMVMSNNTSNKSELKSYKFTQSMYSIILQIPMLSLTLFDPMISRIMGLQEYVDYAISLKIANGIFLLLFSHLQLNVLQNDRPNVNLKITSGLSFLLLVLISINSLFYGFTSVFIQCCILSIIINLVSIIVRIHLRFEAINLKFALFTTSILFIYLGLTYGLYLKKINFENYAVVIAAFIVSGSLPLLWRAFRGPDVNTRVAGF